MGKSIRFHGPNPKTQEGWTHDLGYLGLAVKVSQKNLLKLQKTQL